MKQKIAATISLITLALILALSSCDTVAGGSSSGSSSSGGKNGVPITITLPPLGNASIRALSSEQVSRLQKETASYRVVFSGGGQNVTLSGSSSSFSASFPVGTQVSITVYCLNADGDVIVETVTKTITVSSGANRLDFKLSEDGNEIIPPPPPSPPAPPPSVKSAVSYELDGGDWSSTSVPPQTEEYDEGATVTITTNVPTKQGFTFLGWKSSVSSLVPSGGGDNFQAGSTFTMPSSAVTFTAQWTSLPTHTVTYDLGFDPSSGSRTSTAQVPEGAAVSLTAPSAERVGYEFKYWLNGQAQAPSGLTMGNSDITLVADWNMITYSITYNPDGGTVNPSSDTFDVTTGTINLPHADGKTGYSFDYWKTADGTRVTSDSSQLAALVPSGSTTLALTAVWREETYNIEYTVASGEGTGTATATFTINGGNVTLNGGTAGFTRGGYRIASWKYDDNSSAGNAGAQVSASALIAKAGGSTSLQLTAVWTPIQYTITYNANGGGNNPASTTFTVESGTVTLAADSSLSKSGSTFDGWSTQQNGTAITDTSTQALIGLMSGSNTSVTLYAVWQGDLKSAPSVGDIIMSDGTVKTSADTINTADAIAVVYKVENGKAWAVGKTHGTSLKWADDSLSPKPEGYDKFFTTLQNELGGSKGDYTFSNYIDGSTGFDKFLSEISDYNENPDRYPAWKWVNGYGTSTSNYSSGWYFPSPKELYEIYQANASNGIINTALGKAGGTSFTGIYFSSSQHLSKSDRDGSIDTSSSATMSGYIDFSDGSYGGTNRGAERNVCAVRVFTY